MENPLSKFLATLRACKSVKPRPRRRRSARNVSLVEALDVRLLLTAGPSYHLADAVNITVANRDGAVVVVDDVHSDMRYDWAAGADEHGPDRSNGQDAGDFRLILPVNITVANSSDVAVVIGDIFSDNTFVWEGTSYGSFDVRMPINFRVVNSENVTIDAEDFFSDNAFAWAGDGGAVVTNSVASSGGTTSDAVGGPFRVRMPVDFDVVNSTGVTIDIEDVFGDDAFAWSSGGAVVSNAVGGPVTAKGNDVGGRFDLDMSVSYHVVNSESVTIDVEDYFGDNAFEWAGDGGDAVVTNSVGGGSPTSGHVGGPFHVRMPVDYRVVNSAGVTIDVEDVFGDNAFAWAGDGGDAVVTNSVGGRPDDPSIVGGRFDLDMPVDYRVVMSKRVTADVEDYFGDNAFEWAGDGSDAVVTNSVGGGSSTSGYVGGPFHVRIPVGYQVVNSESVTIDIEDYFGDNSFEWAGDGGAASSDAVGGRRGNPSTVGGRFDLDTPIGYQVVNSQSITIDVEDYFGDNSFMWAGGPAVAATAAKGEPGGRSQAAGAYGSFVANTPVSIRLINSEDVGINIEDVLGDNRFVWEGTSDDDRRLRIIAPVTVFVVNSRDVSVAIADVFGDNVFDRGGSAGGDGDGHHEEDVFVHAPVRRRVIRSEGVTIVIVSVAEDNVFLC